jgi:hypothetical protein
MHMSSEFRASTGRAKEGYCFEGVDNFYFKAVYIKLSTDRLLRDGRR